MIKTIKDVENFMESRNEFGIKPGLERIHNLLKRVNHPEKQVKAVHVAGTNGKGSTIRFLEAALMNNGYRVGTFTSPSFSKINGHFLINDKEMTDQELIRIINLLLPFIVELDQKNDHPTAFEIITVLAFLYFCRRVDIALIETGMGGRYDTTNCFIPIVSVITNISKDHTAYLGKTLKEIAYHKAGIIKRNSPVVVGDMTYEAQEVMEKSASDNHAPIYQLRKHFFYKQQDNKFIWCDQKDQIKNYSLKLKGTHQADNAAIAYMVLNMLRQKGYSLNDEKIAEAFKEARLPGRFEVIHSQPLIVLDSAHNTAGIKAFLQTLKSLYPDPNNQLLFAGFKDKQLQEMLQLLDGNFKKITLTTFDHKRAAPISLYNGLQLAPNIEMNEEWEDVIIKVLQDKQEGNSLFITGSLHFITVVRKFICEKTQNL